MDINGFVFIVFGLVLGLIIEKYPKKIKLNIKYKCKHCGNLYTIIKGAYIYSILPVEIITGDEIYDLEFDKEKHKSHLLSCEELKNQWPEVKEMYRKQVFRKNKNEIDEFLR